MGLMSTEKIRGKYLFLIIATQTKKCGTQLHPIKIMKAQMGSKSTLQLQHIVT